MTELSCPGVGRDKDCLSALQFYFNRRVTDDEMRFLHDVMRRAAACIPASPLTGPVSDRTANNTDAYPDKAAAPSPPGDRE